LAFTYEAVRHVSSLWGLSVRPCGKEAKFLLSICGWSGDFSGGCTSLFGWHFTVDGFVRSSAWFSSCNDGAHPRVPWVRLALVMSRGLLAVVFIIVIICVVEMFPHSSLWSSLALPLSCRSCSVCRARARAQVCVRERDRETERRPAGGGAKWRRRQEILLRRKRSRYRSIRRRI